MTTTRELNILHADLDAFFAAVEVLDDPSLAGKPLIIGYPGRRGVVSTASYEARQFGVHSAMPSIEALRRCPEGVWRRPRGARYAAISREVMAIFRDFTPEVEPLSLDEAFLDVESSRRLFGEAVSIAEQIRKRVHEETGLVVSIGVAENKFLAKIASDLGKPDGLTVVPPGGAIEFLAPLPIRRLWGVGPRSEEKLASIGIRKIEDLQRLDRDFLERRLGERGGGHLYELARGIDNRRVEVARAAKSISTESTFETDLTEEAAIDDFLFAAAQEVGRSLRKEGLLARTVTLKARTGSFKTMTRSETLDAATDLGETLYRVARRLLADRVDRGGEGFRLLGVGGSNLVDAESLQQSSLFGDDETETPRGDEERLVDRIAGRHGRDVIGPARTMLQSLREEDRVERHKPDSNPLDRE